MDRRAEGLRVVVKALAARAPDIVVGRAHVDEARERGIDQEEHLADVLGQLPEAKLAFGQIVGRATTLGDFRAKLARGAPHLGVEAGVLIDPADLRGEAAEDLPILLAEFDRAHLVHEADPPVGNARRSDRGGEGGIGPRIAVRQSELRRAAPARPSYRTAFLHDRREETCVDPRALQVCGDRGVDAASREIGALRMVPVVYAEHRIRRADQVAGVAAKAVQQHARVAFGGELQVDVVEGGEPFVGGPKLGHRLRQFVAQYRGHRRKCRLP
jgi:hypothetical protein